MDSLHELLAEISVFHLRRHYIVQTIRNGMTHLVQRCTSPDIVDDIIHIRITAVLNRAQQILQGTAIKLQVLLCRLGRYLAALIAAFIVDAFPVVLETWFAWTARATFYTAPLALQTG